MSRSDGAPAPGSLPASGPGPAAALPQVRQFFRKGGSLAHSHPGYEFRPGQLEMAEAVASSLADARHLIVEAGTGTGKTLAYLVPLICSGRRVVVSTGTKNLQEQLFFKDVPFLEKLFPGRVRVCYMKGRANYACRQKIYEAENQPVLEGLQEVADFQIIRDWEKTTEIGDRAEIRTLPEASTAWAKVDARREMCTGQKCPQFERCFITLMRQRAAESDIIVVNHHLFFADLGLREGDYGSLLPDYQAVVFDEAHEIEDVAAQYFGLAVSSYRFEELCRDISAVAHLKRFGSAELDRTLDMLARVAGEFFGCFEWLEGRRAFHGRQAFLDKHQREYDDLLRALELTDSHLRLLETPPEEVGPLVQRTAEIAKTLVFIMESDDRSMVHWLERRGRGVFLQATPIDIAPLLTERLFDRVQTVVLTSATLAVAGAFEFTRKRLGVGPCRTLVVPGHFDYQRQALLYVPPHLPDPRNAAFMKAASDEVVRLLEITRGRAFVLFTSYQSMRMMYDRVSLEIDYPTLLQGSGPRTALLDEFRSTPNCVLFATSSFWQGVDVPGDQLSCVIIDKLPFAVPSDPVVEARIRSIREQGGNPFYDYQVPQAAIALKQGFGRLVRSRTDRGVLAILDNRIVKQRYGQVFLDSLPDYRFTDRLEDVRGFFDV
jgi:ATP-dependent DNA helicase DinG